MKRILLVNPWIYDFAAYDFGQKPVGLLRIGEHLRRQGNEVRLIDCLAARAPGKDASGFSKFRKEKVARPHTLDRIERPYFRYGISIEEFHAALEKMGEIDEICITSGMTYWYPGLQLAIKLLKERFTGKPVTLGGIYATLCYDHAVATSGADRVCRGDFPEVSFLSAPAYDLLAGKGILPLDLTRGCPFHCSYCASRILAPSFIMKDPLRLFQETVCYYERFGARTFVFYDDALTCRSEEGLKPYLRLINRSGAPVNFHTPNGLHARYIDEELAGLLFVANFREPRLSLETADPALQRATGDKAANPDIERAISRLKKAGYSSGDIGVYIMIGAPWVDLDMTRSDVEFIHALGVKAILASYSPIPGTRDYAALIKMGIIREDTDPLWHNKTVFAELLGSGAVERVGEIRRWASGLNKVIADESSLSSPAGSPG